MTDTDILLRLRAAIHMESARLAPQTSPEIELMREAADALEEIERMRAEANKSEESRVLTGAEQKVMHDALRRSAKKVGNAQ